MFILIYLIWIFKNFEIFWKTSISICMFDSCGNKNWIQIYGCDKVKANKLYVRMHKAARHLTLKCCGAAPTAFMRVEGSAVSTSITHAQGFALCPLVCARGRRYIFHSVGLTTFQGRSVTRVFCFYDIWIL